MQHTLESLLVALLMALNPGESDSPTFTPEENGQQTETASAVPPAPLKMDADSCRQFADPGARRNCVIRTTRALSGSAERSDFPSQTVWVAPEDPGMVFRFRLPNTLR